jgi:hypothetical protein
MPGLLTFEAQIKFATDEQWQLVGVCPSRKQAAGVAAAGFRTTDRIGRLPSQVRVVESHDSFSRRPVI